MQSQKTFFKTISSLGLFHRKHGIRWARAAEDVKNKMSY
ncbi:hypothetical protein TFKS16_2108 [Tannerella forsythia KS16]|uniref:Uncharacterized protein n=1 Tax=Tannerella forsythia (strain ATCC 43037 / JCM 10827 / CCUG 21028 A / KCTC 5666 / FDC 338) TaxID=203275 RepID=G8UJY8_TANFA|nr:hypothetical protein BFO_2312 [Tannerella forsythia 92A2]BAR49573.1 hypothetical protein TF3313_2112 [Tannerella forsythia 3313]BAR52315.1 hypothetical protein TFKS16_2108 [Tannerella forsythia KS16]